MKPIIIGVAGGTGSGKTTVSEAILERVGRERITYIQHDSHYKNLSHLPPFTDRSFDLISAVEILQHLEGSDQALGELTRVSRGYVLVTVPFNEVLHEIACPHCLRIFKLSGHIQSYDRERLQGLMGGAGLEVVQMHRYVPGIDGRRVPTSLKTLLKMILTHELEHIGYIGGLARKRR